MDKRSSQIERSASRLKNKLTAVLQSVTQRAAALQESLEHQVSTEMHQQLLLISEKLKLLRSKILDLRTQSHTDSFDKLQQHSRRFYLVLHGVQETRRSSNATLETFSQELSVHLIIPDIDPCHRLKTWERSRTPADVLRTAPQPLYQVLFL